MKSTVVTLDEFLKGMRETTNFNRTDEFEVWYRAQNILKPDRYPKRQEEQEWLGLLVQWASFFR